MSFFVILRIRREAWYTDVCLPCQPSYTLQELLYKARCLYCDPQLSKRLGVARARRFREHIEPLIGVFVQGGDAFDARVVNGCDVGQDVRDVPFAHLLDVLHVQQPPLELTLDVGRSDTITFVVAVPRINGIRVASAPSAHSNGSKKRREQEEEDSGDMSPERMLVCARHSSVTVGMVVQRLLGTSGQAEQQGRCGWALCTCQPVVRRLEANHTLREAGVLSGQLMTLKLV